MATPVVRAHVGDTCITFPSTFKLQDLYNDFKITIEVYSLTTLAEMIPHEVKYHIPGSVKKVSLEILIVLFDLKIVIWLI